MSDNTMADLWTALPNHLIALMPKLGPPATMIAVAVARKTAGWQKESDVISISQFMEMTGLSRQGTIDAIEKAIKIGAVTRTPDKRNGFRYRLVNDVDYSSPTVNDVDQSTTPTSQRSGLALVNDVDQSEPPLVNDVDTQKKDLKKRKKDHVAPVGATDLPEQPVVKTAATPKPKVEPSDHKRLMTEYADALGYKLPNGAKEASAAQRILAAGYTVEQAIAAYHEMKCKPFWASKHLSLHNVYSDMGAMIASGGLSNERQQQLETHQRDSAGVVRNGSANGHLSGADANAAALAASGKGPDRAPLRRAVIDW